ncbi:MAG: glutaminyl-peptide cyclotransferase [Chloroflexota bacterium]|nr:glutaminyl-peptide cyclotransferase [Chloroflexota bacterium]
MRLPSVVFAVGLLTMALVAGCVPTATTPSAAEATVEPTPASVPAPVVPRNEEPFEPAETMTPAAGALDIPVYGYRVINAFPHDPNAWTQGLIFEDGQLYEGTGLRGRSSLRRVDLESGRVGQMVEIPEPYFGEGITEFDDRLFQLSWQESTGFVYEQESLKLLETFTYATEGWGLTQDGQQLIMSDGTPTLHFLDPDSLEVVDQVTVTFAGAPVSRLNELEYIEGEIFANVWQTNVIVRIDPDSGEVIGVIDLSGLLDPEEIDQPAGVLNGIAYDDENDRLYVTGKLWPKLFEIELIPEAE